MPVAIGMPDCACVVDRGGLYSLEVERPQFRTVEAGQLPVPVQAVVAVDQRQEPSAAGILERIDFQHRTKGRLGLVRIGVLPKVVEDQRLAEVPSL